MKNGRTQKYRWAKPNLLLIKKVSQLKFRLTLVVLWGLLFLETRCFIFLEKALINNSAFWGLEKNGPLFPIFLQIISLKQKTFLST